MAERSEQSAGGLTPAGHTRARVGQVLAPLLFAALWLSPLPLEPAAHRLSAIFVAVVVLWVTEALPIAVTALLIAPAMIVTGVTGAEAAFAPYANKLLFLFVGGFMIARSMTRHRLDRRIALGLVSMPIIAGVPARVRGAFMLAGVVLSMWISNTATTAILLPILLGLVGDAGSNADPVSDRQASGSLLCVAYACSIGGLGTPVGSPPNLIAMEFLEQAGIDFSFFDWVSIGLPASLIMVVATFVVLHREFPPGAALGQGAVEAERRPWSRGETVTAVSFSLAVVGWMLPGAMKVLDLPGAAEVKAALPGGAVALIAAAVLFMFRAEDKKLVLPWSDAARIDWGIIMLFGGGISLGHQMIQTGLAEAVARGFVEVTGVESVWTLTALVTVFTIFFTETCSNTATSNMLVPLVIAVCTELSVPVVPPVLAVALAASCAFMLPIATGPNAIAYGTGRVPQVTMMRAGFTLNLVCAALVFLIVRVLCPLYGWA